MMTESAYQGMFIGRRSREFDLFGYWLHLCRMLRAPAVGINRMKIPCPPAFWAGYLYSGAPAVCVLVVHLAVGRSLCQGESVRRGAEAPGGGGDHGYWARSDRSPNQIHGQFDAAVLW